jgi:hypothetical protein
MIGIHLQKLTKIIKITHYLIRICCQSNIRMKTQKMEPQNLI